METVASSFRKKSPNCGEKTILKVSSPSLWSSPRTEKTAQLSKNIGDPLGIVMAEFSGVKSRSPRLKYQRS